MVAAAIIALAVLFAAGPAAAQGMGLGLGLSDVRTRSGGGVLDGFTAPTAAYGLRLLRSAYLGTGAVIRLRRASDNAEADIGFGGSNDLDLASATAFCAATSCFVRTWYDQSGIGRDMVQATAANQPALVFDCTGALPCMRITSTTTVTLATASVTPATGVVSFSVVGRRDSGTGVCTFIRQNGNVHRVQASNGLANFWGLLGAAGSFTAAAADNVWHAGQAVLNGAASSLSIDGVTATGTATGGVTAGATQVIGSGTSVCSFAEAVLWDAYVLTAGESAALTANQRSFWSTP